MVTGAINRQSHRSRRILITAPDRPGDMPKRRASTWRFRLPGDLAWYETMARHTSEAKARDEIKAQWAGAKVREIHRAN